MPRLNGIEAARQIREIEAEGTKARVHIVRVVDSSGFVLPRSDVLPDDKQVALSGLSGDSPYHSDAVNDGISRLLSSGLPNLITDEVFFSY